MSCTTCMSRSHGCCIAQGSDTPHLVVEVDTDLSGATATMCVVRKTSGAVLFDGPADVVVDTVVHEWQPGETDVPGQYQVQVTITYPDGAVQVLPACGALTFTISPSVC